MAVQRAQEAYAAAKMNTQKNMEELQATIAQKKSADFSMYESYDKYIHHLWEKDVHLRQVEAEKQEAIKIEQQKLVECEMEVKVLEKHKEKCRDIYKEEEKAAELKEMSEVGVQKFFIRSRDEKEEQEILEQLKQQER
ncbi:hypothetical protein IJ732_05875 [bacterium]|nr:hypothetical protein [bacterium]